MLLVLCFACLLWGYCNWFTLVKGYASENIQAAQTVLDEF